MSSKILVTTDHESRVAPQTPRTKLLEAITGDSCQTRVEAFSYMLADGRLLEAIHPVGSQGLELAVASGSNFSVTHELEAAGCTYAAVPLSLSWLQACTFPQAVSTKLSAAQLVTTICQAAEELGLATDDALLFAAFALSTWFADLLPACPTLLLEGPYGLAAEAFSSLLTAVCRHPLHLADFTPAVRTQLPEGLCPTLFLDGAVLSPSALRLLAAGRSSAASLLRAGQPVRFPSARVVTFDCLPEGPWVAHALHIVVPALVPPAATAPRADLQPELLGYRLTQYRLVQESTFTAQALDPSLQPIARDLGRCVAGEGNLQQQIVRAFQARSTDAQAARSGSLQAIVLEALISEIHGGAILVRVARICENANHILLYRGESTVLGDRQVGALLRSLGLLTERLDRLGRGLRLTNEVQAKVHELARRFNARALDSPHPDCPWCRRATST